MNKDNIRSHIEGRRNQVHKLDRTIASFGPGTFKLEYYNGFYKRALSYLEELGEGAFIAKIENEDAFVPRYVVEDLIHFVKTGFPLLPENIIDWADYVEEERRKKQAIHDEALQKLDVAHRAEKERRIAQLREDERRRKLEELGLLPEDISKLRQPTPEADKPTGFLSRLRS